jgi:mono/diheme cytochrome c family protein
MKTNTTLLSLALLTLISSCGQKASPLDFQVNQPLGADEVVTYARIKAEIIAPHCLACHSSVNTEAALKGWITPGHPETSPFFTTVENGSMPKGQTPLDTYSLDLIRNYISQMSSSTTGGTTTGGTTTGGTTTGGSTTGGSSTGGTTTGISYAEVKARILTPYSCTSCHSVSTEAKLAKWLNKTSPASSSFYTTMKSGSMPQGGTDVSATDLAFALQYIKDYAKR